MNNTVTVQVGYNPAYREEEAKFITERYGLTNPAYAEAILNKISLCQDLQSISWMENEPSVSVSDYEEVVKDLRQYYDEAEAKIFCAKWNPCSNPFCPKFFRRLKRFNGTKRNRMS